MEKAEMRSLSVKSILPKIGLEIIVFFLKIVQYHGQLPT